MVRITRIDSFRYGLFLIYTIFGLLLLTVQPIIFIIQIHLIVEGSIGVSFHIKEIILPVFDCYDTLVISRDNNTIYYKPASTAIYVMNGLN